MTNRPQARMNDLVVNEFETEVLIYDLKVNKAYCLNPTSAMIWNLCDGNRSIAEISRILAATSKQPISEDLIWLALDQFKKDNLLENNEQFEINFNGLSRRQVIKKVGLASMIALPVISSLVAPTAAHGASRAALFASCASPSDCASNFCTNMPARCCVPGTSGNRGFNVCCDGSPGNCNPRCCSNTGTISANAGCAAFGGFSIACPNS